MHYVVLLYSAITSTEYPDYNIEVDTDFVKNQKNCATSLDIQYGSDSKNTKNRLLVSQELDYVGNIRNLKFDHVAKLKWKAMVS